MTQLLSSYMDALVVIVGAKPSISSSELGDVFKGLASSLLKSISGYFFLKLLTHMVIKLSQYKIDEIDRADNKVVENEDNRNLAHIQPGYKRKLLSDFFCCLVVVVISYLISLILEYVGAK